MPSPDAAGPLPSARYCSAPCPPRCRRAAPRRAANPARPPAAAPAASLPALPEPGRARSPQGQPLRGARSLRAAARTGLAGADTGAGSDAPDGALFCCCCCYYRLPLCAPQPYVCASRCHVSPRMNNRGVRHAAVSWAGSRGLKVIARMAIGKLSLYFFSSSLFTLHGL